jgi:transcriptional regulator with XRE-family HTH domain
MSRHQVARPWFWLRGDGGAGRALAGVRRTVGLTQAEIARRLGMDRTTLIDIEAGRNTAVNRFVGLFNRMGYDLIAVPRGARVTVEADDEGEPVP